VNRTLVLLPASPIQSLPGGSSRLGPPLAKFSPPPAPSVQFLDRPFIFLPRLPPTVQTRLPITPQLSPSLNRVRTPSRPPPPPLPRLRFARDFLDGSLASRPHALGCTPFVRPHPPTSVSSFRNINSYSLFGGCLEVGLRWERPSGFRGIIAVRLQLICATDICSCGNCDSTTFPVSRALPSLSLISFAFSGTHDLRLCFHLKI